MPGQSVSSVVSLTILSFSDCCQLLGKELGRERLLPYRSRGQRVRDWNICDWCVGQDHNGGHAQPSSPPSSQTHIKTQEMFKPQLRPLFLIPPIARFLPQRRTTPRVSELQHPLPIKLAGTATKSTPETLNPLFLYLTLRINTTPLLLYLFSFLREQPSLLSL